MLLLEKRIFIVEDNASNLAVASAHLRTQGATVLFERWGYDTAQVIIRSLPIDVILLDLMLPNGVNGFDVYDSIRQHSELQNIPIVIVSAADPDEVMPIARSKGCAGFISKPISIYITKYVAEVLQGKSVWIAESQR